MTSRSARRQKKKGSQLSHTNQERMASSLVHRYQPSVQDNKVYPVRLTVQTVLASNGIGLLNGIITMNPSGSAEWTVNSNLYDDFRVMGIRVRLISLQQYSVTALCTPVVIAYDDNNATALASFDAGLQYNTHHLFPSVFQMSAFGAQNRDCCLEYVFMRPTAGKDTAVIWVDTANPGNTLGAVKFYGGSLTNSTNYITACVDYYVQFRGRN